MILADLTIANQPRKVIMQAPKNGFFYVLDRANGKLISGEPFAYTSWARSIDKDTGRPIETEEARYRNTPVRLSPSPVGAHHWPPMAFNPVTKLVYYPGQETSSVFARRRSSSSRKGSGTSACAAAPARFRRRRRRIRRRRRLGGFFVAWDPVANKQAWRIPFQSQAAARCRRPAS